MCGAVSGRKIAEVAYWDLQESDLVACDTCGLAQLDPMLGDREMATGCRAFHILEALSEPPASQARNCLRKYRGGVAFASRLRSAGIEPGRILEMGPGNGYFSAGMQFVLPAAKVTVLDILEEVLDRNARDHGFETIHAAPDTIDPRQAGEFDLVVAADLIEHVQDIGTAIRNVHALLAAGGHFHFTTPNGREDAWPAHARWQLSRRPAELLINHVNYFEPSRFERYLHGAGFRTVSYYLIPGKGARRGRGWRLAERIASPESSRRSAPAMIAENQQALRSIAIERAAALDEWWLRPRFRWLATWYCRRRTHATIRLPAALDLGHEIIALMQKPAAS